MTTSWGTNQIITFIRQIQKICRTCERGGDDFLALQAFYVENLGLDEFWEELLLRRVEKSSTFSLSEPPGPHEGCGCNSRNISEGTQDECLTPWLLVDHGLTRFD